ncbi:MAG: flagellar hook-basal body complex protein FliE [Geminicoccaceae bacterium]
MAIVGIGQALKAYSAAARAVEAPAAAPQPLAGDFGAMVRAGLQSTSAQLEASETKAVEALTGRASLQDVVEAVTEAELSLQKMTAMRDRVISAYQEIMRMPI